MARERAGHKFLRWFSERVSELAGCRLSCSWARAAQRMPLDADIVVAGCSEQDWFAASTVRAIVHRLNNNKRERRCVIVRRLHESERSYYNYYARSRLLLHLRGLLAWCVGASCVPTVAMVPWNRGADLVAHGTQQRTASQQVSGRFARQRLHPPLGARCESRTR